VVMQLLKEKLGDQLTSEGAKAWKKTVDVMYKEIFAGLRSCDA
jgi:hypothetical protein